MCGITGYKRFDGNYVNIETLKEMGNSISHRGPDSEGIWCNLDVGFAHKRLSVIDLSDDASQPMISSCKRYVICYNGEIYNYKDIKLELLSLGYKFKTNSDTEVILVAWKHWGEECLLKFNGMFSFALYDNLKSNLHLCRDRYGIKPLYYFYDKKNFIFGSEIKSILVNNLYKSSLDFEAILEYFTFQNLFTNKTFFKNIQIISPGSHVILNEKGRLIENIWWDFNFQEPEKRLNKEEYLEELQLLFEQAVKRQLISDVPVGSYLSGGIDSASITAIASKNITDLRTFTVGFDLFSASGLELNFDERKASEHMSYLYGTEHYEMILKSGDMVKCMPKLSWHVEEPRVGQSYPNYYAAKLVSKFDKVVLAGTGGDELFGGYPWRYHRAVENDNFDDYIDKYYQHWHRLIPNKYIKNIFSPIWDEVSHVWTRDIFYDVFKNRNKQLQKSNDYVNHSLYFESKTFLHGLLMIEDKLSMAHGLETRVPFLDNDLVDFAMHLPVDMKIGNFKKNIKLNENDYGPKSENYYKISKDGKLILRELFSKYVPEKFTKKQKQGFSGPDASWFRGESIDYVKEKLFNPKALIFNILHKNNVQNLVYEHLNGQNNRRLLIWSLLYFEEFLSNYFND